jgi:hypothetical protein
MDLKEIGCEDVNQILPARDSTERGVLVNPVMNFRV